MKYVQCLIILAIIIAGGCSKKEDVNQPKERTINVRVGKVEKKSYRPFLEAVGTLVPLEEVIVSAEVDGIIKSIQVEEGSATGKGMILAEISDRDYVLEANRAETTVIQAEATLNNVRLEYERKEALLKEELITKQQFDDVSTRLALAKAELERARASLALAKERQSKTLIRSPLDGVVKERRLNPGSFVRTGSPIFSVIRIDPIKLVFSVSEQEIGKVKVGQEVNFKVTPLSQREFTGRVSLIHPSLDERTRSLKVEALAPNKERLLKPGLFANVTVYTEREREMYLLPISAIVTEREKNQIFIVEGDAAKAREVKLGLKYGEWVEITSGISGSEQVVMVGQQNLIDGMKVHVAR